MRTLLLVLLFSITAAHACDFSSYNASCTDQLFTDISTGNITDLEDVHHEYLNDTGRLADACNQGNCSGLTAIPQEERSSFFNESDLFRYNTTQILRHRYHINARWPYFLHYYHNASAKEQRQLRNKIGGFRGHPFDESFFRALNSKTAEENFFKVYKFGDISRFFGDLRGFNEMWNAFMAWVEGPGDLDNLPAEKQAEALEENPAFDDVHIPTDAPVSAESGLLWLGNNSIRRHSFTHGSNSLHLEDGTLTVNDRYHLSGTRNLSLTQEGFTADRIASGSSIITTNISGTRYRFNASFSSSEGVRLRPDRLRFARTDITIRRTPGIDYFIGNASELILDLNRLRMRAAATAYFSDTLLSGCTDLTFPFRFRDTLLDRPVNLTTHEKIEGNARRMRISGTNNPGISKSTLLIDEDVEYANLTATGDGTYHFKEDFLKLDEGEHAEYAHTDDIFLRTNESITARLGGHTVRTSTYPLVTRHLDSAMVLARMNGKLALFNNTQFIEKADSAEMLSNASGAYVRLNHTYPLPAGDPPNIHARTEGTIKDIPGALELVNAAGTPVARRSGAWMASGPDSMSWQRAQGSTYPMDPTMVLTRMNGKLALFNNTQFIEAADSAEMLSTAAGAYIRLNHTYPLPEGFPRNVHSRGEASLNRIPGALELASAAGTPVTSRSGAWTAPDRESQFIKRGDNITVTNARMSSERDNYTEEIHAPSNITVTTDNNGIRCMQLGPHSLYLFTPAHAHSIGFQAERIRYRLCLRKRAEQNFTADEPFSGVFDILNHSAQLRDRVRMLRYPIRDGQQASLQLATRLISTIGSDISASYSEDFRNTTQLSVTGPTTTWSSWHYFTIREREINNSLHRLLRLDPAYEADSRLRTYQSPSAPAARLHSRSFIQPRARVLPISDSEAQHILTLTASSTE